jgi:bifunctional non-homologous end joining protein LigD
MAKRATKAQAAVGSESGAKPVGASARGDLTRYRAKRDFSITPEPAGEKAEQAGAKLRYVIQKHAARRLHYDLRLELDGVYKSWAVTRGPSLDPQEKRLAVHVEDHPIGYGDFEGIIPAGEYGGGTVMIWDRGTWVPEYDPEYGYTKGHLAFDFDGEKLKGRWHLVRTKPRPGDKKEQWLLFKADDAFARPESEGVILDEAPNSVATGRTMDEIAQQKAAVWSSKGSGLVEGTLSPPSEPEPAPARAKSAPKAKVKRSREQAPLAFIPPCLAQLSDVAPSGEQWLHEIKFDGYRLMVIVEDGRVRLFTRSGLDWTHRFPGIANGFETLPASSAIVDCEAVVEDENGVSNFSALQEGLSDGRPAKAAIAYAFDLLHLNGEDMAGKPLDARKAALAPLIAENASPAIRYSEHIVADGSAMVEHACRLGLEGIVSKRRDAPYRSGRHGEWLKIKCTNREEFVIGGYVPSTAARNAIGSLVLGYYEGGRFKHAGRTGTGFTAKSAQALYTTLHAMKAPKSPFADVLTSDEKRGVTFTEPKLVAEVEFRGWTGDKHLRHAAFKGLREDKPATEVTLEKPAAPDGNGDASKGKPVRAGKAATSKADAVLEGVKLTHPDRILWKDQGLTKLGLAEYYASVADEILPHITDRPLALIRCPAGSEGECFFQKHAFAGLSDAVSVVPVKDGDGTEETLVIRDLRGLITLVQANVLEIHPWGASIGDVEKADRIIFDLDPGDGVGWDAVIEAALEVRERLRQTGVESFVKTSGGKGLHVVANIEPEYDWTDVKAFTHGIAKAMEADAPSRFVSTMAKKVRAGKIFVDYLRNGRGATAVSAYSTRARANAPVSTPVSWDELGPALSPARYTVDNIGKRLAALRTDPWSGFFANPQRLTLDAGKGRKRRSR